VTGCKFVKFKPQATDISKLNQKLKKKEWKNERKRIILATSLLLVYHKKAMEAANIDSYNKGIYVNATATLQYA